MLEKCLNNTGDDKTNNFFVFTQTIFRLKTFKCRRWMNKGGRAYVSYYKTVWRQSVRISNAKEKQSWRKKKTQCAIKQKAASARAITLFLINLKLLTLFAWFSVLAHLSIWRAHTCVWCPHIVRVIAFAFATFLLVVLLSFHILPTFARFVCKPARHLRWPKRFMLFSIRSGVILQWPLFFRCNKWQNS